MGKNCIVCTTPYQIIAAVSIAYLEKSIFDLVIVPQFSNAELYAKSICEKKIFDRVIISNFDEINKYKNRKSKVSVELGILEQYLSLNNTIPFYFGDCNYSRVYISSQAIVGRLISLYYFKRGAEIVYFDDGEGSYDKESIYEAKGFDRVIRSVLFGKQSIGFSKSRQLYCPELFELTFGKEYQVSKIPNWSQNKELLAYFNNIFQFSDQALINEKYVLIDTIPHESFDDEGKDIYLSLRDNCIETLGNNMIIKKHPRDNSNIRSECAIYQYNSIPFELICANSDIENKVLITSSSSAVFMPKLLFDSEPVVILLHHITGLKQGNNIKREKMIQYLQNLYRENSRFLIPKSIDEFEDLLKVLTREH